MRGFGDGDWGEVGGKGALDCKGDLDIGGFFVL